jgi:hypothetical protein
MIVSGGRRMPYSFLHDSIRGDEVQNGEFHVTDTLAAKIRVTERPAVSMLTIIEGSGKVRDHGLDKGHF